MRQYESWLERIIDSRVSLPAETDTQSHSAWKSPSVSRNFYIRHQYIVTVYKQALYSDWKIPVLMNTNILTFSKAYIRLSTPLKTAI